MHEPAAAAGENQSSTEPRQHRSDLAKVLGARSGKTIEIFDMASGLTAQIRGNVGSLGFSWHEGCARVPLVRHPPREGKPLLLTMGPSRC